jgi:tRNA A37 threonylcarbamoyladenosine biosynthesis protein TsaE
VTIIEWAERGKGMLPLDRLDIRIGHKGPRSRLIEIVPRGKLKVGCSS